MSQRWEKSRASKSRAETDIGSLGMVYKQLVLKHGVSEGNVAIHEQRTSLHYYVGSTDTLTSIQDEEGVSRSEWFHGYLGQ